MSVVVTRPVYLALLHYPIMNRDGQEVTTAVTNLDIHDISRSCRTFGVKEYFLVTPIEDQHEMVGKILAHWSSDEARQYHPDRVEAVSLVRLVKTFEELKAALLARHGEAPEVVLTDARKRPNTISYSELRKELENPSNPSTRPLVVVFGTGWGVSETFYPEVHRILVPVYGPEGDVDAEPSSASHVKKGGYNHLSVRAAVAIILDRLFGC